MSLTRRGKIVMGAGVVAVGIVALSTILALAGKNPPVLGKASVIGHPETEAPPTCPLTDKEVKKVPNRPALAIKVENLPEARPQAGLNKADVVYEEPVEGGITRFIVVYQCQDSSRIGPVRSARFTDAGVLSQFGHPLFGYAGGVPQVEHAVDAAGVKDVNYNIAIDAYVRDPNRSMPHNLYTSSTALYESAHETGTPEPVFQYDTDVPDHAKKVGFAHLDFSSSSDVYWRWNAKRAVWLRYHGTDPHLLEGDVQVQAKNVVVQLVRIKGTDVYDVAGNNSPEAVTTGSGKAYVFRNGRMIVGTWVRQGQDETTKFLTKSGDEIKLTPGNTWVELFPNTLKVETGQA